MQVNAIITATAGTKDIKTTISYLRQSQEAKAEEFCQRLNLLTTNTFKNAQINEINIQKTIPTLTLSPWQTGTNEYVYSINYNGNGDLYVNCTKPAQINSEKTRLAIQASSSETFSGIIFATETNAYYSKAVNFERNV